jgi:hypothetical protein
VDDDDDQGQKYEGLSRDVFIPNKKKKHIIFDMVLLNDYPSNFTLK